MTAGRRPPRIGVFDSGVGGLTVVAALRQELPAADLLYLGDTARLPYGTKSAETVRRYTERNVRFLVERRVDVVVVACNTASALALPLDIDLPVVGVVEPGARRAAALARRGVGVLATESTVASGAYQQALARLRADLPVCAVACPLFVPLVEEGWFDDPVTEQVARRYLERLEGEPDVLVLGCTHYPMLAPLLGRVAAGAALVDSAQAVARHLVDEGLVRGGERGSGSLALYVTDLADRFGRIAREILGGDAPLQWIDL